MDYARQQRNPARHAIAIALVVLAHALVIYALFTGLDRAVVEVIEKPVTAAIIAEVGAPPPPLPPLLAPLRAPGAMVAPPTIRMPVTLPLPRPAPPVPAPAPAPVKSAVTAPPPTVPDAIAPPAAARAPAAAVRAPPAVVHAPATVAMARPAVVDAPAAVVIAPPARVHAPEAVASPAVGPAAPTGVKAAPGPASARPPPQPAVRRGIEPIEREDPIYPRAAIRANVTRGRVVARLQIDERGSVTEVEIRVSEPPRIFDRAVRTALERWRFKPDGEKYLGEIEVNFSLKDE